MEVAMAGLALSPAPAPSAGAAGATLRGAVAALADRLARWRRRRAVHATIATLGALDDRTLRDIGISRSELASVATNPRFERMRGPRPF
jgi:uncharacterized protein YjiS (DUF1127 family)